MGKYRHARNRVYLKVDEPELQWLEDSCGILVHFTVLYTKMLLGGLCKVAYGILCLGLSAMPAQKQKPQLAAEKPQQVVVILQPPRLRPAIRVVQKRLPYITVKALPPQ
ncbi:hypothetical protein [Sphingorhabdus sp.]|uniref:hypothetical protein n=1 Tax=Sphingorhabdus sp. TaxID=1902408 RepID=UPI0033400C75